MNIPAMRLGKGKHLKGRTLMGGIVSPEEFDHFHEVGGKVYLRRPVTDISIAYSEL